MRHFKPTDVCKTCVEKIYSKLEMIIGMNLSLRCQFVTKIDNEVGKMESFRHARVAENFFSQAESMILHVN
jgi:hypothetical protein